MADILVADDEEVLLELIRFSLASAGHSVTAVKNGKMAVDESRKKKFDLIVMDVMMPVLDGYHAASEINQDPKAPPILLLTSRDYDQDQAAIKGSGVSAFLSKPFEVNELLETIATLVKK